MYSAYKLNKQGDNIQPWRSPFPIWHQSVVPCPVLTWFLTWIQISQEAGQVVWYSHLFQNFPQFIVIHTVKGFGIVNKAEIDVSLERSCFLDPEDVGNLISGSSAFSKTSLNIRKFKVRILLKPGLENFEHYFTSLWDECNCAVVWAFFDIAFLRDWNENWSERWCCESAALNMPANLENSALEKEMATHSSVLAWRIPGMGEPGGLPSMGSHRVGHDWSDLAEAAAYLHYWNYINITYLFLVNFLFAVKFTFPTLILIFLWLVFA